MQPGPSGQRSGSACSSGKSRRVGICVIHRVDRFTSAPTLPTCRRFLDACLERCVKPARSTTSIGTFELFADNGSEMALRKGPSGARLQILLKTNRCFLSRELHRDDERPGPMMNGMTRRTAVVPFQPIADVRCDPDVVSRRIGVAAEDVDDSLLEAMHASRVTQGSGHMGVPAIPPNHTSSYAGFATLEQRPGGGNFNGAVRPQRDGLSLERTAYAGAVQLALWPKRWS